MIFVDTGFWVALASEKDPAHGRVAEVFRSFKERIGIEPLLTTNHVVFESLTLARSAIGHSAGAALGERLYAESLARIHWATPEDEKAAFAYYCRYRDKDYSAVDCLSFVIMERGPPQKT